MQLQDVGPLADKFAAAVATLSYTPLADRAGLIQGVFVDKVSAADTWYFTIGGRVVGAMRVDTVGNQQMLSGPASGAPKNNNVFDYLLGSQNIDLSYPVPQGLTFQVSSLGGATGDVHILFQEFSPGDLNPGMLNHPEGRHFLAPIFLAPPNNITHASGVNEDNYTAQYGLPWLPTLYGNVQIPAGWEIDILDIFLEGGGVNTFSGSANHASVSDHVALLYKGTRYFTRDAGGGITNIGTASAAGSANTVYGADASYAPAFQVQNDYLQPTLPSAIRLRGGDTVNFLFGTSGDSTGGADYSHFYTVLLCRIRLGA